MEGVVGGTLGGERRGLAEGEEWLGVIQQTDDCYTFLRTGLPRYGGGAGYRRGDEEGPSARSLEGFSRPPLPPAFRAGDGVSLRAHTQQYEEDSIDTVGESERAEL